MGAARFNKNHKLLFQLIKNINWTKKCTNTYGWNNINTVKTN